MFVQKRKEMNKEYEKQEKRIKDMKQHGQSKKSAVRILNVFKVNYLSIEYKFIYCRRKNKRIT